MPIVVFVVSRRGALLVVEDGDEEDEEVDEGLVLLVVEHGAEGEVEAEGVILLFFEEEEEAAAAAEGVVFLFFDEEDEEDVAAGIASLLSEGPDENDEAGGVVVDVDEDAIARASIKAWRYSGELSSMVLRLPTRDSSHFRDNSPTGTHGPSSLATTSSPRATQRWLADEVGSYDRSCKASR